MSPHEKGRVRRPRDRWEAGADSEETTFSAEARDGGRDGRLTPFLGRGIRQRIRTQTVGEDDDYGHEDNARLSE